MDNEFDNIESVGNTETYINYFSRKYKTAPSEVYVSQSIYLEELDNFIKKYKFKLIATSKNSANELFIYECQKQKCILRFNKDSIDIIGKIQKTDIGFFIYLYYDVNYTDQTLVSEIKEKNQKERVKRKNNKSVYFLIAEQNSLKLKNVEINYQIDDLSLNYGDKFKKETHPKIIDFLRGPKTGLLLFHGKPGTGKTSYIKHLLSEIEEKDIIFVSPSIVNKISSPDYLGFFLDRKNSIFIIEDSEEIVKSREEKEYTSSEVSNLLNLTDGILGEAIKLKIICTFNTDLKKIDKALLRKGRLILAHEFDLLNIKETNRLMTSLNKAEVTAPMSLADIDNYETDNNKPVETTNAKSIGFNAK